MLKHMDLGEPEKTFNKIHEFYSEEHSMKHDRIFLKMDRSIFNMRVLLQVLLSSSFQKISATLASEVILSFSSFSACFGESCFPGP